ncbi:hypothetical protein [Roseibium marinum]|nr:hypothetical protein [Roseibium marinum]
MGNKFEIREVLEVFPHWETDHTAKGASYITGTVVFEGRVPGDEVESRIEYGLRVEDSSANAQLVRKYLQIWLEAGGVIPEWVPPTDEELRELMPPLTARQFRLGLLQCGRSLEQVDKAISVIEDDIERAHAQIELEYATEFKRANILLMSLWSALCFTPEEVDVLWQEALQL